MLIMNGVNLHFAEFRKISLSPHSEFSSLLSSHIPSDLSAINHISLALSWDFSCMFFNLFIMPTCGGGSVSVWKKLLFLASEWMIEFDRLLIEMLKMDFNILLNLWFFCTQQGWSSLSGLILLTDFTWLNFYNYHREWLRDKRENVVVAAA